MAPADLVVTDANLLTMDDARPRATALAVRDGTIVRVGDAPDVAPLVGPHTRRLTLDGATVVPGFHDCHLHLLWFGTSLTTQAALVGAASIDELLGRLSAFAAGDANWVQGHGFDQAVLAERCFPTRDDLDRVSATRPILVTRICGHAMVANSAAIALLDDAERAAGDARSGLFTETAMRPLLSRVPPLDDDRLDRALLAACEVALHNGITSVGTILDDVGQLRTYERLRARLGRLPIRMTMMPPESAAESLRERGQTTGNGDAWLRMGGAKFFADGSLGARTALLSEPYADDPAAGSGTRIYPAEALKQRVAAVAAMGFQVVVHAIGDRALVETNDAIEHALAGGPNVMRHRVEHASACPPAQLERLARLGVHVAVQPQFVTSDTWTVDRLGPRRAAWAYPFRSMLRAGVPLGLSSDCPVEPLDAFACLASAVGRHPWSPRETLTPLEAIRAYTLGSAATVGRHRELGSLEAGKLADFVVLSGDPTTMNVDELRRLRAEHVFVNGAEATRF